MTSFEHPQRKFCRSSFVIHAMVNSVNRIDGPPDDAGTDNLAVYKYDILVMKKLKGPFQMRSDKEVIVETTGNRDLCSLNLTVGEEYVLSGLKTVAGGFRSLSSDIVYNMKYLATRPLIRNYLLGRGRETYKRNCNRGCTDISSGSIYCKTPDMNGQAAIVALHCFLNNAICKRKNRQCQWYNADSC
ncbi:uncharacterized protein [Mytilus edulis]|uniref:uncharacterized protein n=1 Tax=Mytilus edulis TaxID=6550 RepID=UPI0039F0152C